MPPDHGLSIIQRAVLRAVPSLALPQGARVLDAPCGRGELSVALRDAGFDVTAADIDPQGGGVLGNTFVRADLAKPLPWDDAAFDAVLCLEGIEHLENRFGFLRELARVLKPSGLLVLTTPNTAAVRSRVRFFGSGFFHHDPRPLREASPHPLHHIGLATLPELRYALHTSGFRLERATHTHIKPVSWLYAVLAPWMWAYTAIAFRKERDATQRDHNRAIRAALFSPSVLFGENLLLIARRTG